MAPERWEMDEHHSDMEELLHEQVKVQQVIHPAFRRRRNVVFAILLALILLCVVFRNWLRSVPLRITGVPVGLWSENGTLVLGRRQQFDIKVSNWQTESELLRRQRRTL